MNSEPKRLYGPEVGEAVGFRAAGYEFRDSGHVFDRRGELRGHVAYLRLTSGLEAPILAAWHGWLERGSPKAGRKRKGGRGEGA